MLGEIPAGEIPNNVFYFLVHSTILKTKDKPWCSYGGVIKGNLLLQQEG